MGKNDEKQQKIDLLPFVVEAFGYNKKIYKSIDRLYKKHKYTFYKAAYQSNLYNHQIVTEGNLLQEEYCRKALGILLCTNDNNTEELDAIILKGWTYEYLYVKNHADEINLEDFINKIVKKANGIDNLTDEEINTRITMLAFITLREGEKLVENGAYDIFFNKTIMQRMEHYKGNYMYRINYDSTSKENKEKVKELRNLIYKEYGPLKSFETIEECKELRNLTDLLDFIFDYERLSAGNIMDLPFTQKDVDELIYLYVISHTNKKYDIEKAAKFLITCIYIRYLIKAYKQVKQHYFENNKETMFVELEGTEKELENVKSELQHKDDAIADMQRQIEQKDRELNRLKNEVAELNQNRSELNSLREFMFGMDHKQEYIPEKIDTSRLKEVRGLILGGHPKWQEKMKELLPSFTFIAPDALNFDVNVLKNIDIVFIYTDYLSHAIYYKLMPETQKMNIKIQYLAASTNTDIVLQEIYKMI